MKTSLVVMAAGLGSRFKGGIKQLEPVDDFNHIIMDYSVHDAISAGFNKIIFVIRKDIESDFKEAIGNRIEQVCASHNVEVAYAFQEREAIPEGFVVPPERIKPWGTGHAVLSAKRLIREPFAVINADDYYGRSAFDNVRKFLVSEPGESHFCMPGFTLKNTLSEYGGVTRGICQVNQNGYLSNIVETKNIIKTETGACADDRILDPNVLVSMNMWGLTPDFLDVLEEGFIHFFETEVKLQPLQAEYLLPIYIGKLLQESAIRVKVLETNDMWFGVTYQEDKPVVFRNFRELINAGIYGCDLYGDLSDRKAPL